MAAPRSVAARYTPRYLTPGRSDEFATPRDGSPRRATTPRMVVVAGGACDLHSPCSYRSVFHLAGATGLRGSSLLVLAVVIAHVAVVSRDGLCVERHAAIPSAGTMATPLHRPQVCQLAILGTQVTAPGGFPLRNARAGCGQSCAGFGRHAAAGAAQTGRYRPGSILAVGGVPTQRRSLSDTKTALRYPARAVGHRDLAVCQCRGTAGHQRRHAILVRSTQKTSTC